MTTAEIFEGDISIVAAGTPHALIAEADISFVAPPPTAARIMEGSVSVLSTIGPTITQPRIFEGSVSILAYLALCVTRHCQLWKITRTDGKIFAFTSLDVDFPWGDITFKSCGSLADMATQSVADVGGIGSTQLTGILSDTGITDEDLYAGRFRDAYFEAWEVSWDSTLGDSSVPMRLAAGWFGKITRRQNSWMVEVLGPGARLKQTGLVDFYTPGCRWEFGDIPTCGVNADAMEVEDCFVTNAIGRGVVFFDFGSQPPGPGLWNDGKVIWTSGRNAGITCQDETVDLGAGVLSLWDLAPYPPQPGDTFRLRPGCPKTEAGCKAYNNYLRFGGFKNIPSPDALQSNADSLFT